MKTYPRLLTIALLIFASLQVVSLPVQAQDPTSPQHAAKAEELMSLLNIDKNMQGAFAQVEKMQEQMMDSKSLSPEEKEKQAKMRKNILEITKSIFNWETLKPAFIQIYAGTFSEEELQGMIEFYKTPVGQKWIEKQPELQAATMQKMQSLMLEAQPKIQAVIKKEMDAEKPASAAASPDSVNPPFVK